jgi:hypothetical protein
MTGGPAFPVTKPNHQYTGMTLLDYFAGQAMSAIRSTYDVDRAQTEHAWIEIAELAYCQARVMLEVRKRIEDRQQ